MPRVFTTPSSRRASWTLDAAWFVRNTSSNPMDDAWKPKGASGNGGRSKRLTINAQPMATSSAGQISSKIVERNQPTTFRTCLLLREWARHWRAPQTIDIDKWDEIFLASLLSSLPCVCARRLQATARAVSPKRGDAGFVPFVCVGRRRIFRLLMDVRYRVDCVSLAALGGLLFTSELQCC